MATKPLWLQHREPAEYVTESDLAFRLRLVRWLGHRRWIPRGQDRLLRLLLPPVGCPHFFFEVDFFGKRYRGDLSHYVDWMVFCYGAAAMPELTLLRESVNAIRSKNGGAVLALDIGGNVGHHTTFLSGIADQVITFEPYAPLQQQIEAKIALNKIGNVKLMPFGLGEKDDVLNYYPGMGANSGVGSFLHAEDLGNATPIKLQIRRGDSVLEELGVGKVDIMKVDVEGFEAAVLRGLHDRIHRDRPAILTEISDESRRQFGSEQMFRQTFYPDAHFFEVGVREGHSYILQPFRYETASEVLITAPEMGWLRQALLQSNS